MTIDDVLGSMHEDRMNAAREQLAHLDAQLLKRGLVGSRLSAVLIAQIEELTEQINHLQPEGGMPDIRRRDREPLERERRELQRSLQLEAIQHWRDLIQPRQEERHVIKEAREEQQRYTRLHGALYDV